MRALLPAVAASRGAGAREQGPGRECVRVLVLVMGV